MAGMAFAGVAAASLQLSLHAVVDDWGGGGATVAVRSLEEVGAYVALGVLVLAACVAVHAHLTVLPPIAQRIESVEGTPDACAHVLTSRCRRRALRRRAHDSSAELDSLSLLSSAARVELGPASSEGEGAETASEPRAEAVLLRGEPSLQPPQPAPSDTSTLPTALGDPGRSPLPPHNESWVRALLRVATAAVHPAAAVAHCFAATFLVYPGVIAIIPNRSVAWLDSQSWFSALLLLYAVADFGGVCAGRARVKRSSTPLFLFRPHPRWAAFGPAAAPLARLCAGALLSRASAARMREGLAWRGGRLGGRVCCPSPWPYERTRRHTCGHAEGGDSA